MKKGMSFLSIAKMLLGILIVLSFCQCKKFLDKKIRKTDIVPTSLDQLWPILDNNEVVNNSDPYLAELVADNYYVSEQDWNSLSSTSEAQNYIWAVDALSDGISWSYPYNSPIYFSNVVLDQLPQINYTNAERNNYNAIKGACLFYRSFEFFSLAQLFCKPYNQQVLDSPGIIIRLTSNPGVRSTRATIKESYDRVIDDLILAADLLPVHTIFPTRPSKTAAYAMLARVYLSMRQYKEAGKYADLALQLKNDLLDFNTLIPVGFPPIQTFNSEVIYHSCAVNDYFMSASVAKIDSNLYNSYDDHDLRKAVFFIPTTDGYVFQGSFNGTSSPDAVFTGLTTGELYLIRAECFARNGMTMEAVNDLNYLLQKRWDASVVYTDITATDAADALSKILTERRKELVYRGQRWTDIRRLNQESANINLKRIIGSDVYTLSPNDLRSVLLIPTEEINKSGIKQNPR